MIHTCTFSYGSICAVRYKIRNSRKFGKFSPKTVERNFREFREIFSGDSREFRKSPGTFPEIRGFFTEHALRRRVHGGKPRRTSKKIRENFPENPTDGISGNFGKLFPGIPGNSGNPRELFRKFGGFPRTRAAEQGARP